MQPPGGNQSGIIGRRAILRKQRRLVEGKHGKFA
jgi:hypothetical protein